MSPERITEDLELCSLARSQQGDVLHVDVEGRPLAFEKVDDSGAAMSGWRLPSDNGDGGPSLELTLSEQIPNSGSSFAARRVVIMHDDILGVVVGGSNIIQKLGIINGATLEKAQNEQRDHAA
jgi:hypothetical protein